MMCSLLTLWLIYRRNRNGYIHLIIMLTFSQFIYDMSTVMVILPGHPAEYSYIAIRSMSGLWATFLTNILSFIIVHTVWTLQPIPITSYLMTIRLWVFCPATLLGILIPMTLYSSSETAFLVVSQIYYWARILSILFNIGSYFTLVYKLNSVLKSTPSNIQRNIYRNGNPLTSLVKRFKYYPIVQVLTRVCVAYYEEIYGHDYDYQSSFTLKKKISTLLYLLTLPSAGLGFFIVFLVVSPGAIEQMQEDWNWCMTQCFGEVCYGQFRRRLSSTYQDGDPIFPATPASPGRVGYDDGRESEMSRPTELSWHESSLTNARSDSSKERRKGRYDDLDEDELSSEITRMYSTSSSGLRHYSLSDGYESGGSKPETKKIQSLAESLLTLTELEPEAEML